MSSNPELRQLPRLLYIGNVPAESGVAGAALLYRLLATWPTDRLRILEIAPKPSAAALRIAHADYRFKPLPGARLLNTRLGAWWRGRLFKAAIHGGGRVLKYADAAEFKPEAILTVAHGQSWAAAADAARRLGVPLHLIVHDDYLPSTAVPSTLHPLVTSVFAETYRAAASRLCVSPYMVEAYGNSFGVPGEVIYPSRAPGATAFTEPPTRLVEQNRPLTYGYAGSVSSDGYRRLLKSLAEALARSGDRLLIHSNLSVESAQQIGLHGPLVEIKPFIPFAELIQRFRNHIDVLFVPMSFDAGDQVNMKISFPSKLTDYTAIGLPLLICGPAYCSAVRWAIQNSPVAEVVTDESVDSLSIAVKRLTDPARRNELARRAISIGQASFSHEATFAKFAGILASPHRNI